MFVIVCRCTEQAKIPGLAYLEKKREEKEESNPLEWGGDTPKHNGRSVGSVESRRWREGHVELQPI